MILMKRYLVTGATGRIGPHVMEALETRNIFLRVATPDPVESGPAIEWVRTDFLENVDYERLVGGCDGVIHLAASLFDQSNMHRVNVEATGKLAEAAETSNVSVFIYTSSSGVYGNPRSRVIDETTPVLDISSMNGFLQSKVLYDYCVTKLLGEYEIRSVARKTRYIFARLLNVVNESQIADVLTWGWKTRLWRAHRYTHQIYVKDAAAALVYLMDWASNSGSLRPGQVDVFNVGDNVAENRYGELFRRYQKAIGAPDRLGWVQVPCFLDVLKDALKYRCFSGNLPAGLSVYSPAKLLSIGFRHPYGILNVQNRVIADLVARHT